MHALLRTEAAGPVPATLATGDGGSGGALPDTAEGEAMVRPPALAPALAMGMPVTACTAEDAARDLVADTSSCVATACSTTMCAR
jgi:hypothetical protein